MIPILSRTGRVDRQSEDRPDQEEREHRAEHEHVAVGEVDELDDAVDEGVAERHQGEDQAVGEADDLGLEELLRGRRRGRRPPGRPRTRRCRSGRARSHGRSLPPVATNRRDRDRTRAGRTARPDRGTDWWSGGRYSLTREDQLERRRPAGLDLVPADRATDGVAVRRRRSSCRGRSPGPWSP